MGRCESRRRALLPELPHKLVSIFTQFVTVVLLITSVLKLSAVATAITEFDRPDPVFTFLTTRQTLLLAAGLEGLVALTLTCRWEDRRALGLIMWLGLAMAAYRGAAWLSGWTGPCHCLGGRYGLAYIIPVYLQDGLAKALLVWMVVGAGILDFWAGRNNRVTSTGSPSDPRKPVKEST